MLHLLYILVFTIVAFLAISNLIRSLIAVSSETNRRFTANPTNGQSARANKRTLHPEMLDEQGQPVNEPLLVIRSVSMTDAREQLDALYEASPNVQPEIEE